MTQRIFSGVQPSGTLTLGNYLGALKNWTLLQKEYDCLFCIVNMHAITVPQDPDTLRQQTLEIAATYLACGIDPEQSHIFVQSHVPAHAQLGWILGCKTPMGWLNRMTQFKEKAGKHKERASLGLYGYPTLQAADILLYQTDGVPVGEDQKQHIELTRDIALSFNSAYEKDFFTIPEPMIQKEAARIMSLRDGTSKMSKSDPSDYSRLNLTDNADTLALKIKKAKTDSEPLPGTPTGLEGRPEAKNLVTIFAALSDLSLQEVCTRFEGARFSDFKPQLSDLVVETIAPIGVSIKRYLADKEELETCLKKGADYANKIAVQTLKEVYQIVGLSLN
jgi:tryptophanyl-tRNA synthetase